MILMNNMLHDNVNFEPRTETGSEHFACQDNGLSQIFKLIVSTSENILNNIIAVV